jgi:hypothetical protein
MDNRYSYEHPPKVGTIILTPSGNRATVTSIGRFNAVNVKVEGRGLSLTLDANQCRKTPEAMAAEMADFDARR